METRIALFQKKEIRKTLHAGEWWFVIVDVVAALTDSANPSGYLKDMRRRDPALADALKGGGQIAPPLALEVPTAGGPQNILCWHTEGIFRLIQSIPSPKAEPFKRWLAKVGYERMQDMSDPARSLDRAREYWRQHGRSEKWIQQRMMGQETRNKLTDYWKDHEITGEEEYAILTNIIHQEWSGVSVKKHKDLKGLKTQNLRDHMSEAELIFTALAELSTRQIAESVEATGMTENAAAGKQGGTIAKGARLELERKTGRRVVTEENFLPPAAERKKIKGPEEG